ncbi:Neurogenic differentiation factor 1 [Penaeus vannamei]|uniref:Neurogenic differentiation factor 1 n=1 Tax=Penaeus vannamei TaxID=6689 RepID=A0A3R7NS63_PENVA|nr:Neurogenic differentiation factor 1 [Penaeus vannamei]
MKRLRSFKSGVTRREAGGRPPPAAPDTRLNRPTFPPAARHRPPLARAFREICISCDSIWMSPSLSHEPRAEGPKRSRGFLDVGLRQTRRPTSQTRCCTTDDISASPEKEELPLGQHMFAQFLHAANAAAIYSGIKGFLDGTLVRSREVTGELGLGRVGKPRLKSSSRIAEKYGLRPRTVVRRLQLEKGRDDLPGASSKTPRIRPPPLSKYRRKTANARERHRMKEINDAFETLRRITTLKLAVNYIRALSHILQDGHPGDISFFDGLGIDDLSIEASAPLASRGPVLQCPGRGAFQQAFPTPSAALPSCSASAAGRGSSGSSSDLSDLLSDDSCVFEDNLDAFDDIPALPEADPFALLLNPEEEALALTS